MQLSEWSLGPSTHGDARCLHRGPIPQQLEARDVVQFEVLQLRRLVVTSRRGARILRLVGRQCILRGPRRRRRALLGALRAVQRIRRPLLRGRSCLERDLSGGHVGSALLGGWGRLVHCLRERSELVLEKGADLLQDHGVEGATLRGLLPAAAWQGAHQGLVHTTLEEGEQLVIVLSGVIRLALDDDTQARRHNRLECGFLHPRCDHDQISHALHLLLVLPSRLRLIRGRCSLCEGRCFRPDFLGRCNKFLLCVLEGAFELGLAALDVDHLLALCNCCFLELGRDLVDDLPDHGHHGALRLVSLTVRRGKGRRDAGQQHLAACLGKVRGLLDGFDDTSARRVHLLPLRRRCCGGSLRLALRGGGSGGLPRHRARRHGSGSSGGCLRTDCGQSLPA
mmetsp:Transcript_105990/g.269205  ORF Transcript_105990/g.269205 Transcript_105990/m.269205 type:complete len:395 (+) Transcript_105990:248-1432(+)